MEKCEQDVACLIFCSTFVVDKVQTKILSPTSVSQFGYQIKRLNTVLDAECSLLTKLMLHLNRDGILHPIQTPLTVKTFYCLEVLVKIWKRVDVKYSLGLTSPIFHV